jgi:Protein of unknown function (DUF4054)
MAYTAPTPAELRIRFPAFAAVTDEVINYWLADARVTVTDAWIEADRAPGEMELAAHNMAGNGYGSAGGAVAGLAAMGVTDFKSGAMSASFDAETVRAANAGGYGSTRYGVLFLTRLRRNVGGAFLAGCAYPVCG